jgi:hypothetical protein
VGNYIKYLSTTKLKFIKSFEILTVKVQILILLRGSNHEKNMDQGEAKMVI